MKPLKNKMSFIKFLLLLLASGLLSVISRVNAIVTGPNIQPFLFMDLPSVYYMASSDKPELPFGFYLTYLTALGNMTRNTLSNSPNTYSPLFIYPAWEWMPPNPKIYRSYAVREMPLSPPYVEAFFSILSSYIGYHNTLYNNIIFYNMTPRMFMPYQALNLFESSTDGAHPFPEYESLMVPGMPSSPEFYPWSPSFERFFIEPLFPAEYYYDHETNYTNGREPQWELLSVDVIGYVYDNKIYRPLEGVKVSIKNGLTGYSVRTSYNGRFVIELFPDRYTLLFSKEGYQDTELYIKAIIGMETLFVFMEKEIHNRAPVLDIPFIEVIADETIMLDPLSIAHDPDGDPLSITFWGWKADYWLSGSGYTTTEADIGAHEVYVTVSDQESIITESMVICVFPGYDILLYEGLNLISYPFENGDPNFTAFDLLEKLGGFPRIDSIAFYVNYADTYVNAYYDPNGKPLGDDFPIRIGEGYVVYANEDLERRVINRYTEEEHFHELYEGTNLIGMASCPAEYTSYDLLMVLKKNNAESISCYDSFWGDWRFTYWSNGCPAGDIFPVLMGEGYYIHIQQGL